VGDARDPALNTTIKAAIVLLCAGAFLLIVLTISGADGSDAGSRALGTALAVVFFLLSATAGAGLARRRANLAWFGYLTAILSILALAGSVAAIWGAFEGEGDTWGKAIAIAAVLSLAGAHASLLLGPRYRDAGRRVRMLRNATLVLLGALAAFVVYAILASGADVDAKLVTVVVILYALGSVVLPLARRGSLAEGPLAPSRTAIPAPDVSPVDLLVEHGLELVEGPLPTEDARGGGSRSVLRRPNGTTIELWEEER
jgi:hypothetical protein